MTERRATPSASSLVGDEVVNATGDTPGKLEESMVEVDERLIIGAPKERLEKAPGFDEADGPDLSKADERMTIDRYHTF